jgi:hypothetical protein
MARMTADPAAGQLPSTDLLVLITGLTQSWALAPRDLLTAADGSDPYRPERLAEHRAVVVEAARRLCAPAPEAAVGPA